MSSDVMRTISNVQKRVEHLERFRSPVGPGGSGMVAHDIDGVWHNLLDTTNFDAILSILDDDVQKALDTLDDHNHDDRYLNRIIRMGATWTTYEKSVAGLTAALAAAVAGDTVWVPPGTYAGDFTIPDGVLLRGASRDGCTIDGSLSAGCSTRLYSFSIVKTYNDAQDRYAIIFTGGAPGYVREVYIQLEQTGSGSATGILVPVAQTVYVKDCFIECSEARGFAVRIDHDISSGVPLTVTDREDPGFPLVLPETWYEEVDQIPPPGFRFVEARLSWRFAPSAVTADYIYFFADYSAFVLSQVCHGVDYPIRARLRASQFGSSAGDSQYFADGVWTDIGAGVTFGIDDRNANCGTYEHKDGLFLRIRNPGAGGRRITLRVESRIGATGFDGIGISRMWWSEVRFGGGVYLDDNYLYGSEADIAAEKARVYVQGNTYRPEFVVLTDSDLIPEPGDRSAWDVDDYPDEHASDIASATPLYHWLEADIENVADAQIAVHAADADAHQNRLHDVEDVLDHETVRTDTSLVFKPDGAGAVEFAAIAVGDLPAITHATTTSRDAANSHPASAIREAVTIGRVMQGNSVTGDLEASTLVKSGAGVVTIDAGAAYTLTIPATGTAALGAGTLTAATANDVTGANHTHAITNTTDGDTTVSTILRAGANGELRVRRFGVGAAALAVNGTIALPDAGRIGNAEEQARLGFNSSGATNYAYFLGCNVGVGRVSPAVLLDVRSAVTSGANVLAQFLTDGVFDDTSGKLGIRMGRSFDSPNRLVEFGYGSRLTFGQAPYFYITIAASEACRVTDARNLLLGTTTDGMTAGGSLAIAQNLAHRGSYAGFYNTTPITKPAVAGARNDPEEALANLLTALTNLGLITNNTTDV